MSKEAPYRIAPYEHGLCIEKRYVAASGRHAGVPTWVKHKYPQSLEQACDTLLELLVRDHASHHHIRDALALERTVRRSVATVRKIAHEYAKGAA